MPFSQIIVDKSPLGSGGEGEIRKILSPVSYENCCVKWYTKPEAKREAKVRYMVQNPPPHLIGSVHRICWPNEPFYEKNVFKGFVMPLAFDGSIQLYELCTRQVRTELIKPWGDKFARGTGEGLVKRFKLCANIAIAIHAIHSLNRYVLVDMKPQNILVNPEGKISMIDLDSIQITDNRQRVHYCSQYTTPEYRPPEANRLNYQQDSIPMTWDYFSMAVIFYEVIFGIHPFVATYSGPYEECTQIADKIEKGLFVHDDSKSRHIKALPPLHQNFNAIPQALQTLFIRALKHGCREPDIRPTAVDWYNGFYKSITDFEQIYSQDNFVTRLVYWLKQFLK